MKGEGSLLSGLVNIRQVPFSHVFFCKLCFHGRDFFQELNLRCSGQDGETIVVHFQSVYTRQYFFKIASALYGFVREKFRRSSTSFNCTVIIKGSLVEKLPSYGDLKMQ